MISEEKHLRQFGKFRLDVERQVLWHEQEPVNLPLKEIELLCALTEHGGEVVTKNELLEKVWGDSFVEESNLSRHIYLIRKTFKDYGESEDLIQTVPRRGYRFAGEVRCGNGELIIEKHSLTRTLIEELPAGDVQRLGRRAGDLTTSRLRHAILTRSQLVILGAVVVTIALSGVALWRYNRPTASKISVIKSIAVLPLKSFAQSSEDEELRLRITDALITKLGGLHEVSVRPTNSILRFAKAETDAVEAGKILQVEAVLDGRIQIEGERLRVTLQLISVETGEHIWSGQFDGNANQILFLQDSVSSALLPKLAKEQTATFAKNPTTNPQAYGHYLKGRYFWNKRTAESYWKALEYFQKAVQEDPNFATAYTGIADTYILLNQRAVLTPDEAFPKAEEAAKQALFLDENLAESHTSLAAINHLYHYDWDTAIKHYKRAIELNPNSALTRGWYGMLLLALGRFEEAYASLKKAEELDPTSLNISVYLTVNFSMSRQYDQVIAQFQKTLELDPDINALKAPYWELSRSYEMQEKYDEAVEVELKRREKALPQTVEPLRAAYKEAGIMGFWKKQIELLKVEVKNQRGLEYEIAGRYSILGDKENALAYIEKYSPQRGSGWSFLKVEPIFDKVRNEPRFQTVLQKMNLQN